MLEIRVALDMSTRYGSWTRMGCRVVRKPANDCLESSAERRGYENRVRRIEGCPPPDLEGG